MLTNDVLTNSVLFRNRSYLPMYDDYLSDNPGDGEFGQRSRPSRRKSPTNWPLILTVLFGGGGLLLIALCCGGGWYVVKFGMDVLAEEVRAQLEDNAVIQEHVGTIESMSMDYTKTAAVEGDDVLVFRIEGDKASGYVTVESVTNEAGMEDVRSGSLKLDSGETFPLFPEDTAPAEDLPADADE